MASPVAQSLGVFKVIGGTTKNGIIVRKGKETSSEACSKRLATGAIVEAIERDEAGKNSRVSYKLLMGSGPADGWVSASFDGKELLEGVSSKQMGLLHYSSQLRSSISGSSMYDRQEFGWQKKIETDDAVSTDVGSDTSENEAAEDIHSLLMRDLEAQLDKHKKGEAEKKLAARAEYDIGWKVEHIPTNTGACKQLGCGFVPEGMVCLVFKEDTRTVHVAPTIEPASAINLEYLALALQVRRGEGREPYFSLDPVDGTSVRDKSMQIKRFEPEWLAGTSVGEVLFQSDYHLKELSMGEFAQPVMGMKSCFDYNDEQMNDAEWSAREWFMVRKADVQMSENNVLIPEVQMGVEAREQVLGDRGLEDKKVSKPHNPLVRYAEVFTHNFDLIAERKSVVSHLRELAKASIMAKFLLDSGVRLDESWFQLSSEVSEACCMEVPQLWHSRYQLQVPDIKDGAMMQSDKAFGTMRSVYGGVQFGLDRFQLSGATRVGGPAAAGLAARSVMTARMGVSPMRAAATGLKTSMIASARSVGPMRAAAGLSAFRTVSPMRAAAGLSATRMASPMRAAAGLTATRMMGAPRGVDLDLGRFDLSAPKRIATGGDLQGLLNASISEGFWESIEEGSRTFSEKEQKLLQAIFHPSLCDRREEGDLFAPPACSPNYVQRLRNLVKEEEQAMIAEQKK